MAPRRADEAFIPQIVLAPERAQVRYPPLMTKQGNPAFEFVKAQLAKKPGTPYAEIAEAAKAKGFKIYPIIYGRAQLLLGHVKPGKSAAKKKAAKKKAARAAAAAKPAEAARTPTTSKGRKAKKTGKRGPRAAASAPASGGLVGIDSIISHVRSLEREREELRNVLSKIVALLDGV